MRKILSHLIVICVLIGKISYAEESVVAKKYDASKQQVLEFEKNLQIKEAETKKLEDELLALRKKLISDYYNQAIEKISEKKHLHTPSVKEALENFIKKYPKHHELTAHALLILGEQYFVESEAKFLENEDSDDKQADFSLAIKTYTRLIQDFPDYAFIDIAYYVVGICYSYEDRSKEALHAWQQLVEKFPNSLLKDEIWFRLGDEEFSNRDFEAAATSYQKITNPNSSFYPKALYKLAWTYYILNRFDDAIRGFTNVLDYQKSQVGKPSLSTSLLETESKQYLAISFVDQNVEIPEAQFDEEAIEQGLPNLERLKAYFREIGGRPYERDVVVFFSETLSRLAKYSGAEQVLLYAISLDPLHSKNPDLSYRVVQFYEEAGMLEHAMKARRAMLELYMPGSEWDKAMRVKNQRQALSQVHNWLRDSLSKLAFYEHTQARKKLEEGKIAEATALFQAATKFYATYVESFPEQTDVDQMLFFMGEAAFDAQWFLDSGQVFGVVRDWPWKTDYRQKAALNTVFAYRHDIELLQANQKIPVFDLTSVHPENKGKLEQPISPVFAKFIDAVDKLSFLYPEEEHLSNFLFETAGIYYSYGNLDEANARFEKIVSLFPESKVAELAANLILESKLASGLWAEAASEAVRFQGTKIGQRSPEFRRIEVSARFKEAEKIYETAGLLLKEGKEEEARFEFAEASKLYLALLQDDPKSEFADKMLYNAAMALDLSKQLPESIPIFERLYLEFPKSDLAKDAMLKSGVYFEQSLQFHKAAETYLLISQAYGQSKQGGDALLNAALLFEINQDWTKAERAFLEFSRQYTDRSEAADAAVRAERIKDRLDERKGKEQFFLLEKEFLRFKTLKIDGTSGKKQSQQLIEKTKRLTELKKKYEAMALQFKGTKWNLAALYQLGSLYEELFQALVKAPCPTDVAKVDESACDEYHSLLEDKAFVLEEKAISAFVLVKNQFAKGMNEGDEWSLRAEDALHRLRPDEYGVADRPLAAIAPTAICPAFVDTREEISAAYAALRKDPKDILARLRIVQVLYHEGKYEAGYAALEDTLLIDDKNPCVYLWLGHISSHRKAWIEARDFYEKAIELAADSSSSLYLNLGNTYFMNKQYDKAQSSYEKELKVDGLAQTYFNLGLLYLNGEFPQMRTLDRLTQARNYFTEYLQKGSLDPSLKNRVDGYLLLLQRKIEIEKQKENIKGDN